MPRFAFIVEDDKDVAELYRHVLESIEFKTQVLRTGEDASAQLATTAPDVVVLDMRLPAQLSGNDVLHQIRADKRLAGTRVIVVTGFPELAETVREKADAVLVKPVDVSQMSDLVAQWYPRDSN